MKRPYKYFILCNKTKEVIRETNSPPKSYDLETWEQVEGAEIGTKMKKQTKTAYIDTRYEAKLRLYNYITYTKNGLEIPRYNPYKNSEVGKSLPILNF